MNVLKNSAQNRVADGLHRKSSKGFTGWKAPTHPIARAIVTAHARRAGPSFSRARFRKSGTGMNEFRQMIKNRTLIGSVRIAVPQALRVTASGEGSSEVSLLFLVVQPWGIQIGNLWRQRSNTLRDYGHDQLDIRHAMLRDVCDNFVNFAVQPLVVPRLSIVPLPLVSSGTC